MIDYETKWITDERLSCRIQFCFVEIGTSEAVDAGLRYVPNHGSQSLPFFGRQNTISIATIDRLWKKSISDTLKAPKRNI